MDQTVHFPVKLDTPPQAEMSQEHVCRLDNGVEMTLTVQVIIASYVIKHNFPETKAVV